MKDFRCKYCGGYINPSTLKCEYCDTQYKAEADDFIPIKRVIETNVIPVCARVGIADEVRGRLPEEVWQKRTINMLAESLSREILKHAIIFENYNPRSMMTEYRAIVKIADGKEHLEMED